METSFQVQKQDITNAADSEQPNDKPMDSTELQVVSSSPFRLPNDWVVEEKPRRSDPSHVDRYYYEPHTGRKFRSLLSVQRHLAGETGDDLTVKQMIPKDKNHNFIESGAGNQSSSSGAVDNFLLEENACRAIPKLAEESGTGEIKVRGKRSSRKPANKYSSKAEEAEEEAEEEEEAEAEEEEAEEAEEEEAEEMITPMSVKHSIPSASDEPNKNNTEKNNRAPVHNLSLPPPAKVNWVLSGSEGMWTPYVDGSPVSEFEKLNWAEAFVLSLNDDEQSLDDDDELD